jgi:hypothetical protein
MYVTTAATGLPELTAYFLQNESLKPQTLFQYCHPQSAEGLMTEPPQPGVPKGGRPPVECTNRTCQTERRTGISPLFRHPTGCMRPVL